jgi:hypothetical protein
MDIRAVRALPSGKVRITDIAIHYYVVIPRCVRRVSYGEQQKDEREDTHNLHNNLLDDLHSPGESSLISKVYGLCPAYFYTFLAFF